MRICISGAASQGKSTLIEDMIKEWPMYTRSGDSYRALIKEGKATHSKAATKASQKQILESLISDIQKTKSGDFVIFDRSPLDNLVYTLWSLEKGSSDIDNNFLRECVPLVKEAMRAIDIIFFLPITKVAPVPITAREGREADPTYIAEIDNIFKAIALQHHKKGDCPFFVKDDAPPIIEIFGNPRERIEMIKWYLNVDGKPVETVSSVLSPESIETMETLLREQGFALDSEKKLKAEKDKIIKAKIDPTRR